ncbi:MAG: hypothetical protein ACI4OA_09995 [Selenomonadaceae bacterium]
MTADAVREAFALAVIFSFFHSINVRDVIRYDKEKLIISAFN